MLEFEERAKNGATKRRWEETSGALEEQTKTDNKRYTAARSLVYSQGATTPAADAMTQEANKERAASLADIRSSMAAHPNKGNLRLPPSELAQSPPLQSVASSSSTSQPAVSWSPPPPGTIQRAAPQARQGRHHESCQCKGGATKNSDCQNIARGFREHGNLCLCRGKLTGPGGVTRCVELQSRRDSV